MNDKDPVQPDASTPDSGGGDPRPDSSDPTRRRRVLDDLGGQLEQLRRMRDPGTPGAPHRPSTPAAPAGSDDVAIEARRKVIDEQAQRVDEERQALERERAVLRRERMQFSAERAAASASAASTPSVTPANMTGDVQLKSALEKAQAELGQQGSRLALTVAKADALKHKCDGLEREVHELRAAKKERQSNSGQDASVIEELLEAARSERDTAMESLERMQEEAVKLQAELKSVSSGRKTTSDEEASTREEEHASRLKELEDARARIDELYGLVTRLREEGAQLRQQIEANASGPSADTIRAKAGQLAEVAAHLKTRQRRLAAIRRRLRTAPAGRVPVPAQAPPPPPPSAGRPTSTEDIEERARVMRKLEVFRQQLADRQNALQQAERKMVKRWARPRAISLVGWFFFLALISAAASWFTADQVMPPTIAATVTLEMRGQARTNITDENALAWQTWHAELLANSGFRETVTERLETRGWADPKEAAVGKRINDCITVDTANPKALVLTLTGNDTRECRAFLDIVATTIAAESLRQTHRRTDGTWAEVKGERTERGAKVYSTLHPTALEDERLMIAGGLFVGFQLLLVLVVSLVRRRLLSAKRELESAGGLLNSALPSATAFRVS